MDPIIFLDIDGILKTPQGDVYWARRGIKNLVDPDEPCISHYLCPTACSNLQFILDEVSEAKIVITSTWRKYVPLARIKSVLERNGVDPTRVIDQTKEIYKGCRGDEIEAWLQQNYGHEESMPKFVILDDDSDMGPLNSKLIQSYGFNGLSFSEAHRAASALGAKNLGAHAI